MVLVLPLVGVDAMDALRAASTNGTFTSMAGIGVGGIVYPLILTITSK